jgi:flagella basal body P-ring formation protein FlgA
MKWTPILFFLAGAWAFQGVSQDGSQDPSKERGPGKLVRAPVRIGPPEIQRGDKVAVRVISGSVLLTFEAEAVSSAHIGESVIMLNPESGRRFVARVEDKGKVVVKK